MTNNMFIIILRYKVAIAKIEEFKSEHIKFLEKCYDKNLFLASGPQVPRDGGVIIAHNTSKEEILDVLKQDPFAIYDLADYEIIEFSPTKKTI